MVSHFSFLLYSLTLTPSSTRPNPKFVIYITKKSALLYFVHFDFCLKKSGRKNGTFCKVRDCKRGYKTVNFCKNSAKCRFGNRRKMMYICIKLKEGTAALLFLLPSS